MRKYSGVIAAFVVLGGLFLGIRMLKADQVSPAPLPVRCLRTTQSSTAYTNITYYQGDYITLTNSYMFRDATGTLTQNLHGCSIRVRSGAIGNTNITTATGYIISTNQGKWGAEIIVPAYNPAYIEVTVSNVFNFTYPRFRIATQAKLGD